MAFRDRFTTRQHVRPEEQEGEASAQAATAKRDFARFSELYASRDGKLRFFEDRATGHLAAVDASKLA